MSPIKRPICLHCKKASSYRPEWADPGFPKLCINCILFWYIPEQLKEMENKQEEKKEPK